MRIVVAAVGRLKQGPERELAEHYTKRAADAGRALGLHPIGDGADMAVRPSGGHDHVVADRRLAVQINGDGVLGLHIVETGEDKAKGLLGVRMHLGDGLGRGNQGGPRKCRCGQGMLFLLQKLRFAAKLTPKIGMPCPRFQRVG